MKEIKLTKGFSSKVSDGDYRELVKYKWHLGPKGCAGRSLRKGRNVKLIFMHRQIMNAPEGIQVDHRDMDKLNNCRSNLRLASNSQNQGNTIKRKGNKSSRYKGVYWWRAGSAWRAECAGKFLGSFFHEKKAAHAYDKAAKKFFGKFARTNFGYVRA